MLPPRNQPEAAPSEQAARHTADRPFQTLQRHPPSGRYPAGLCMRQRGGVLGHRLVPSPIQPHRIARPKTARSAQSIIDGPEAVRQPGGMRPGSGSGVSNDAGQRAQRPRCRRSPDCVIGDRSGRGRAGSLAGSGAELRPRAAIERQADACGPDVAIARLWQAKYSQAQALAERPAPQTSGVGLGAGARHKGSARLRVRSGRCGL